MNNQIFSTLKKRLDEAVASGVTDPEVQRNTLKEELQYYILDFVYHHPDHKSWVMYGGSALRICHDLDRMSVDLDFEINQMITEAFLAELKDEVSAYFADTHNLDPDLLNIKINHGRGLTLRFLVGDQLGLEHTSDQVHVKLDLNYFVPPKTVVVERHPINRGQLSFVILSYNMSGLMASKIAAIFKRGERGVGEAIYEEKGRDIYDLLWYMGKQVIPDFDYLKAKNVEEAKDIRTLFNKLTFKMNKVNDENLKQDLTPLFSDQRYIANWLENWLESYFRLLDEYKLRTVTGLKAVQVSQDLRADTFSFAFTYATEEGESVRVVCQLSDHWLDFADRGIPVEIDTIVEKLIGFGGNEATSHPSAEEKLKRYASLFYQKIEAYLQKTDNIMVGDQMTTKIIRMTAKNLNQREQIVLNKPTLLSCELDDLLM